MFPILTAQWKREDYLFILFIGLGIIMTLIFAMNIGGKTTIPVFAEQSLDAADETRWMEVLNTSEAFDFILVSEQDARARVREGRSEIAVVLMKQDYRLIASAHHAVISVVDRHIKTAVSEEQQLQQAARLTEHPDDFRAAVMQSLLEPGMKLTRLQPDGEQRIKNGMQVQLLFAFTLFFSIFTIAFKVNSVIVDRNSGVWNRMILSPLRKTQMYFAYLIYSFCIGFGQILLMLLILQFGFGFDLGSRYGYMLPVIALYVLSIVSFALLLVGFAKNPETNYSIISMVAPLMPLLSGAYFPVSGSVMEAIAQIIPLAHGLEALKGIILFNYGWSELTVPAAKLLLISVLCMGVGINLMESRRLR